MRFAIVSAGAGQYLFTVWDETTTATIFDHKTGFVVHTGLGRAPQTAKSFRYLRIYIPNIKSERVNVNQRATF
jgi:hypothetical protein